MEQVHEKQRRPALVDATDRLINIKHPKEQVLEYSRYHASSHEISTSNKQKTRHYPAETENQRLDHLDDDPYSVLTGLTNSPASPRLSCVPGFIHANNARVSQISTTSTNGSNGNGSGHSQSKRDSRDGKAKRKTHIGPWHLGKTLGKGSSARVRVARHALTGQMVAVKIVPKEKSMLAQTTSLVSLDRQDVALDNSSDGYRRMPYGIEREVAIMKLIDHPNIMKLYDIWENRTEIYMILEYVDNGELFDHIATRGRLPEEEAMLYFRQILSAVGYCHSYNICHRDLKPENVLLNSEGNVKIADFGFAALHQHPNHKLKTSCGSPHYAAPEVCSGKFYRGDKIDIWSMGVILFAALSGSLPFDAEDDVLETMALIKEGRYHMSEYFTTEARDLIFWMLQVDPKRRIGIREIWEHPLLVKYNYLDDFGGAFNPRSTNIRPPIKLKLRRHDIDRELLRHLRSLWHMSDEREIIKLLLNDEQNDQKLFYSLLLKHREAQLENYMPDVAYSSSDYHHVRPLGAVPKLSSRQFVQSNPRGHGRQVSRMTVVSNATKAETVHSYDPFKDSVSQNLAGVDRIFQTNVVVHRGRPTLQDIEPPRRPSHESSIRSANARNQKATLLPPKVFLSRSSLASSTRSRGSGHGVRVALGNKRGVSFSHLKKSLTTASTDTTKKQDHKSRVSSRHSQFSEVTDDGGDALRPIVSAEKPIYIRSRKTEQQTPTQSSAPLKKKADQTPKIWHEDVRQLSSSLAKDCDEAFNRTSLVSTIVSNRTSRDESDQKAYDTPTSSVIRNPDFGDLTISSQPKPGVLSTERSRTSWNDRPLPALPARSDSTSIKFLESRDRSQFVVNGTPRLDHIVSPTDHLMQSELPSSWRPRERRVTSAPVGSRIGQESNRPLPAIVESPLKDTRNSKQNAPKLTEDRGNVKPDRGSRVTSAPESGTYRLYGIDGRTSRRDNHARESIRMVIPYSPSPAKAPPPLNIRKKSSQESPSMSGGLVYSRTRGRSSPGLEASPENDSTSKDRKMTFIRPSSDLKQAFINPVSGESAEKKPKWYKFGSRGTDEKIHQTGNSGVVNPGANDKKKMFGFGRLFGKLKEGDLSVAKQDIWDDSTQSITDPSQEDRPVPYDSQPVGFENPRTRQIEPQQTLLGRLFRMKPATKYICFDVSNKRARQEIASLLRDWRKYGARDVVVDKQRNVVFGRVAAKNYLNIREVSFACEVFAVIEQGKRTPMSIARLTQEKGAASGLAEVAAVLKAVLESRGMLISDKRKIKMMIKTLES